MKYGLHLPVTRRGFMTSAAAASAGLSWPWRTSWALPGTPGGKLRLVFYADIHARVEWETPQAMALAAEAINSKAGDIVVCGGDLITDGFETAEGGVDERWDAYMEMHKAVRGDIYPVIGNHDLVGVVPPDGSPPSEDPRGPFREKMGLDATHYSFDAAGYHFIVVDTIHLPGASTLYEGRVSVEQVDWLREDLAAVSTGTPIVLCTHVPLLTAFYQAVAGATQPGPPDRVVVNNREVLRLFEDHNLVLVLQGHLHVNEMLRWRGTTFITGGAVCGKWWRGAWQGTPEGFGVLTLNEGQVDWEYVSYGWTARRPANA